MVIAYIKIVVMVYVYAKICAIIQCWVLNRIDVNHYGQYRVVIDVAYPAIYVLIHRLMFVITMGILDVCLRASNRALLSIANEYVVGVLAFIPIGILVHTSLTKPSYLYGVLCQKCKKYNTKSDKERLAIFALSSVIYFLTHIWAIIEYANHASAWING